MKKTGKEKSKTKTIGRKNCLGNNSSQKTIRQIIKLIEEIKIADMDKINITGGVDKKIIKFIIKGISQKKINFKKTLYLKEELDLFTKNNIKHVIFDITSGIPGPVRIIKNIIIIPGELPKELYYENLIKKFTKKGRS